MNLIAFPVFSATKNVSSALAAKRVVPGNGDLGPRVPVYRKEE